MTSDVKYSELDAAIARMLDDLVGMGAGEHVHLDEALGLRFGPEDGRYWVELARQVAEAASQRSERFMIVVSLGQLRELPTHIEDRSGIERVGETEPPAVYLQPPHDPPRTWVGEYYRRDMAAGPDELLEFVAASRTLSEARAGEPFEVQLCFQTRADAG